MKVILSRLAKQELDDAKQFYEMELWELGERCSGEVKRAAERISEHPQAWPIEQGEIRKCLLHKFPYKSLYSIEHDYIFIIAVAHQHRQPDYWVKRHKM